jgi:thiosulfate dehydrogenase [quinone] large subunit
MRWSVRILRGFLGVTFLFAGAQKLLDPNFLNRRGADYIGTQLNGFANGSPVATLLHVLGKAPLLTGVGIAIVEIAIGVATLLGIGMTVAAVAGFAVNATLWLSATWHVHPYFLGSDSIYAVAWIALLAGLVEAERTRNPGRAPTLAERIDGMGRREFLRAGAVAGLALGVAIVLKAFAGVPVGSPLKGRPGNAAAGHGGSGATGPSASSSPATAGRTIATLDRLPVGQAVGFSDPGVGPAVLVRLANDSVVAYSRVCTHAGCLVGYDSSQRILYCPCHGAEFDPAHGASVIRGPASTPLRYIKVVVDPATRKVILPNA